MIFMAEGVASIIGDKGARAVMRQAGQRAATNLLEALPLMVQVDEAIRRAGPVMEALGFVGETELVDTNRMVIRGNFIAQKLTDLQLATDRHPAYYFLFGLFEGLVVVLSRARVAFVQHDIDTDREIWMLQLPEQT
jgi:hypothetical protein